MISTFPKGSRIFHADHGEGTVTLREKEAIGINFDNGDVGAYGSSFFARFPGAIVKRGAPDDGDRTKHYKHSPLKAAGIDTSDIPEATEEWFKQARVVSRKRGGVEKAADGAVNPTTAAAQEAGISIEDRIHLDVTGHLPEDF